MKKVVLLLFTLILSLNLVADNNTNKHPKKHSISFYPEIFGAGVQYEYKLSNHFALAVPLSISYIDTDFIKKIFKKIDPISAALWNIDDLDVAYTEVVTGLGLKYLFSPSQSHNSSWYLQPFAEVGYLNYYYFKESDSDKINDHGVVIKTGITVGYQWVADSGFIFAVDLGAMYTWHLLKVKDGWNNKLRLPLPEFGVLFGYAW